MKGRRSERKWTVASAYRWFAALDAAARLEFACGLLALCHPLEVRFLAACLEEMARRDSVALRNADDRANSAARLRLFPPGSPSDASARGRLLVSLALLRSDNRDAAALFCRALQGNGPQRDGEEVVEDKDGECQWVDGSGETRVFNPVLPQHTATSQSQGNACHNAAFVSGHVSPCAPNQRCSPTGLSCSKVGGGPLACDVVEGCSQPGDPGRQNCTNAHQLYEQNEDRTCGQNGSDACGPSMPVNDQNQDRIILKTIGDNENLRDNCRLAQGQSCDLDGPCDKDSCGCNCTDRTRWPDQRYQTEACEGKNPSHDCSTILISCCRLLGGSPSTCQAKSCKRGCVQTYQELLLLYTMASNHPAIAFQHKQTFRQVLHGLRKSLRIARRAETEEEVRNVTADTSRVTSHRNDLSSDDEGTKRQREIFKGRNCVDSEAERSASGEDDLSDFPSQEAVDSQPEEGNFFHIAAMASSPESTLSYGIRATAPSPRLTQPPPQLVQLALGHFPHSNVPGCNRSLGSGQGHAPGALTEVAAPVEWVHTAHSNRHIDAVVLPGQIPDAQAISSVPWSVTVQRERNDVEGRGFLPDLPASERSEHSTDSGEPHDEGDQESDGASAPSQVPNTSFQLGSACTSFASPLHRQMFGNMTPAQLPAHVMEQPLSPFVAVSATAGVSKSGEPCGLVQNPSTSTSNALGSMLATLSLGTAVYSPMPMALSFSRLPANRNPSPSRGTAAQQQSQPPVPMLTPYSQAGVPFSPRARVSDSVSKNVCVAVSTAVTSMTVSATVGASSVLDKEWTGGIRCVPDSCLPLTTAPSASLTPAPGAAGPFPVPLETGYFPPRFSASRFSLPPSFLPENSLQRAPRPQSKMARISRKPRRVESVPTERQDHGTEPISRRLPSAYESNRDPPGRNSIPVCGGDVSLCVPSDPVQRKTGDCFTGRSEILPDGTSAFFGQQSKLPEAEARLSAIPAMLSACGTCGCHRGCGTVVSRVTVPPPHSSAAFSYAGYYSAALAVAPQAPPPPPPPFPFVAVTAAAASASSGTQYPLTLGAPPAFYQTAQYGAHRFPYYASPQVQPSPGTGFATPTLPDMGETRTEFECPGGSLRIGPGPTQPKPKLSCYNCGNSGHQATDCLHPCMDSNQPGMFRIRVISYSDSGDVVE
uniref:uncharacterized protein isoform X2 n=1 Tax=Myxine glutinosa TaxID=7769 RepID=UPI00358E3633